LILLTNIDKIIKSTLYIKNEVLILWSCQLSWMVHCWNIGPYQNCNSSIIK